MMMRMRIHRFILLTAAAGLPTALASAQTAPPATQSPQAQPVAQTPQATVRQAPVAQPVAGSMPAPVAPADQPAPQPALPPPVWTMTDAAELLTFIRVVGAEGLDPSDYDPSGLVIAMASGDPAAMSAAATERFNRLSLDLALGHVRGSDRQNWLIPDTDLDTDRQDMLLRWALHERRVGEALRNLLPTHPQYAALKAALAAAPKEDTAQINRIRLNMDRWRWLPRDLGERYIIVNVPAYTAALVENGVTTSRHRAVAGATKTPTPQLMATATGVIMNPWWEVPKSIEPEVRGKAGYVPVKNDEGKIIRWRQPPGPSNALGSMKFVMPNPDAIYLHDTNARGLFDTKARAYSHGCIRTEHIQALATKLLTEGEGAEWTPERIKEALASKKSVQANFAKPLPVYIVYFSSAALADGSIKNYADIYKKDDKVIEALLDRKSKPGQPAAAAEKVAAR